MLSVIALQKLHLHFTEQKALTFHRFHLEPECEDPAQPCNVARRFPYKADSTRLIDAPSALGKWHICLLKTRLKLDSFSVSA